MTSRALFRDFGELLPLALLACACGVFGLLSHRFLEPANLVNILVQSSSVAIVAIGMTLVLLTGGIDLSVGSIMFLAAAVAGKMVLASRPAPVSLAVAAILALGILFGVVNALFIARLRLMPFVVTLATLYVGRGLALAITQTRAMNLPEQFLKIGQSRLLHVPLPVVLLAVAAISAHALLTQTPFGRQLYALGHDAEAARKAGIHVRRLTATVYILCGLCAALGGIVSVAELGAVSPTFGYQREFAAIAAAVLGGTSLFGGRGSVLPGTVVGAVLIQTIDNGLVIVNANPYAYPVFTAAAIFIAVLSDRLRTLGRTAAAYSV
jgi:ribose transport system permease protein